jgi:hypothetical protein
MLIYSRYVSFFGRNGGIPVHVFRVGAARLR